MSREDNANAPSEADEQSTPINRRRFVKALGVSAGSVAFGGLATGGVSATSDNQSFSVSSASLRSKDTQRSSGTNATSTQSTESAAVVRNSAVSNLIDFMEAQSGLTADRSSDIYISIQTDNADANSYKPQVSVIPLGTEQGSVTVSGSATGGAGFLFVMSALDSGDRVPVAVAGITATPKSGNSLYTRQLYGLKNETPAVTASTTVSGTSGSPATTPSMSSSEIRPLDTVPCAACQVVVSGICTGGGGIIGDYACVAACSAAFGANFIAIFGCASICSALSSAVAAVGCATGSKDICIYAQNHSPIGFGC